MDRDILPAMSIMVAIESVTDVVGHLPLTPSNVLKPRETILPTADVMSIY